MILGEWGGSLDENTINATCYLQITRKTKTQLCFVRRKLGGVPSQGHGGWVLRLFSNIFQAFLSRNQSIYSYSQKTVEPVMTAYKLVTIQFKWWEQLFQCQSVANFCCIWNDEMQDCFNTKRWWCWCWWCLKSILDQMGLQMSQMVIFRWGLQDRVENFIHTTERRLFTNFHRQVETQKKIKVSTFHKLSYKLSKKASNCVCVKWKWNRCFAGWTGTTGWRWTTSGHWRRRPRRSWTRRGRRERSGGPPASSRRSTVLSHGSPRPWSTNLFCGQTSSTSVENQGGPTQAIHVQKDCCET